MVEAELVSSDTVGTSERIAHRASPFQLRAGRGIVRRSLGVVARAAYGLFGILTLIFGLAILAAVPVLQFASLGYLLEAGGRVGRTGRIAAGFVGISKAARIGGIIVGAWLVLLPVRFYAAMWHSARLIDRDSFTSRAGLLALVVLGFLAVLHLIGAMLRGGRLWHFLWPFVSPRRIWRRLCRGGVYIELRDTVCDLVSELRLPHYFWLGVRGFFGGLVWLAIPVTLMAAGPKAPWAGWLGAVSLGIVVLHLPFLQTHLAAENRAAALFSWRATRALWARAPVLFLLVLSVTLISALPLYLLKIEMVPREAAWLPSLFFVMFIFPSRLFAGWAYARAKRRRLPRFWLLRFTARLLALPVAALYVLVVFFSQYTAWHGVLSLYEQHAFLVPVPFLWID